MIGEEEAQSESEQKTWHSKLKEEELVVFHHLFRERERERPICVKERRRDQIVCVSYETAVNQREKKRDTLLLMEIKGYVKYVFCAIFHLFCSVTYNCGFGGSVSKAFAFSML
jgi:hypothetical protein